LKRGAKIQLVALLGLAALAVQQVKAGSAVASDGNGHLSISFGHSKEVDEQEALKLARRNNGPNVRIVAATDVAGYCAIAVAAWGDRGSVFGIGLGRATPEEAKRVAIEHCLKAGGINPKVKGEFRG